ncbi:MAG TPA: NADH-quinone oxidoreductase subunit J [Trebonia sp.]|nr:NADH-quinone oxidoreductase subunit J [Trebonia sp.]
MTAVLLAILGPLAVASGLLVFLLWSMARVTIALLASFLAVGGLLIGLGLAYLGVVVILMMTMEMVIMAVFMVAYMENPAGLVRAASSGRRPVSLAFSTTVFGLLAAGIFVARWPHRAGAPLQARMPLRAGGPPRDATFQLGDALMGPQMLTMVTLGVALLATMVGAVALASGRGRYDRFGDDLKGRPPADPVRGGVGR